MRILVFLLIFIGILLYEDFVIRMVIIFRGIPKAREVIQKRYVSTSRYIFALADRLLGFKIYFDPALQKELPARFMLIANHQSVIEIALFVFLFNRYKLRFAAKESLFHGIPFVSLILRLLGMARISRTGKLSLTFKELERLARMSQSGICPVIYPEGTRSRTGDVGMFHSGAVKVMQRTSPLPIVSVAIDGGYQISRLQEFLFHLDAGKSYKAKIMRIYPAPKTKGDVESVLARAREEIVQQIAKWRSHDK